MGKTILIVGYGPGVSSAVAERFGAEGFSVALVARSASKLDTGVAALKSKGIAAAAFAADAHDPTAIARAANDASAAMGPISAIHWNAFDYGAGDLITAEAAAVRGVLDVAVVSLLAVVQAALPDLKAAGDGAVLITNGALADVNPQIDGMAAAGGVMGLAVANAAKHKLVGLLAERLKGEGVHVGEVMIAGAVKGTPSDRPERGLPSIPSEKIAEQFWRLYRDRKEIRARLS